MEFIQVQGETVGFTPGWDYGSGRRVYKPSAQIISLCVMSMHINRQHWKTPTLPEDYQQWYNIVDNLMWDWLISDRRTKKKRNYLRYSSPHSFRLPREIYDPLIRERFQFDWAPTTFVGSGVSLSLNSEWDPNTPSFARCTTDEFVPIIHGNIYYPWDPRRARTDRVTGEDIEPDRAVYGFWYPKD